MSTEIEEMEEGDFFEVDASQYEVAEEIVRENITEEMLERAAKQARISVEALRDAYIEGALLGISVLREAMLASIVEKKK